MKLPQSWDEITVNQFQECYFVLKKPSLESWVTVISILSGLSQSEVESIPIKKLKKSIFQLQFLLDPKINTKVRRWLYLNGTIYKAVFNANELNTAQTIDIKEFMKPKGISTEDAIVEGLHSLLACIYLPLTFGGFKYDGSRHSKIAEAFKSARIGDVYGTLFFYSVAFRNLTLATEAYGKKQIEILEPHVKEVTEWATQNRILEKGGVGK